jgi:hypothetical protein
MGSAVVEAQVDSDSEPVAAPFAVEAHSSAQSFAPAKSKKRLRGKTGKA